MRDWAPSTHGLCVGEIADCFAEQLGALTAIRSEPGNPRPDVCVSHVMYADDLTLLSNSHKHLQLMLHELEAYADKKGLMVNVSKSEVVVFNSRGASCADLIYKQKKLQLQLKRVHKFKYLGVLFGEDGKMCMGVTYAARPFWLQSKKCTIELGSMHMLCMGGRMHCCGCTNLMPCPLACTVAGFGALAIWVMRLLEVLWYMSGIWVF